MNIRYMRVRYNVNNRVITTALGLDFYLVIKENRCKRVRCNETPLYIDTYMYVCRYQSGRIPGPGGYVAMLSFERVVVTF